MKTNLSTFRMLQIVLVLTLILPTTLLAQSWTIAPISGPSGTTRVIPSAINNNQVVVGTARFPGRSEDTAFRWEGGTMVELELPSGAFSSKATDITDSGVIVGYVSNVQSWSTQGTFAVYWDWNPTSKVSTVHKMNYNHDGANTALNYADYGSFFWGINEKLEMVGTAGVRLPIGANQSLVYTSRPLYSNGGAGYSRVPNDDNLVHALRVNASGLVLFKTNVAVADRAILIGGGTNTLLDLNAGFQGLNDLGQAAGESMQPIGSVQHAMWFDGTTHIDLGTSQPNSRSIADSINNNSWVVGRVGAGSNRAPDFQGAFGYLWQPGAPAKGLTFIGGTSWTIYSGTDINDLNQIVGNGSSIGSTVEGYILTPVGIGYELSGVVIDKSGAPIKDAQVQVLRFNGSSAGDPVKTDATGKYKWNLAAGTYYVTALPNGTYPVATNDGCTVTESTCKITVDKNKTVNFGIAESSNAILKSKITNATTLLKGLVQKITTKNKAAQAKLRKDLQAAANDVAKYVKSNSKTLKPKSKSVNLSKLSTTVKESITKVLKLNAKTFGSDKKGVSSALSSLQKGLA